MRRVGKEDKRSRSQSGTNAEQASQPVDLDPKLHLQATPPTARAETHMTVKLNTSSIRYSCTALVRPNAMAVVPSRAGTPWPCLPLAAPPLPGAGGDTVRRMPHFLRSGWTA